MAEHPKAEAVPTLNASEIADLLKDQPVGGEKIPPRLRPYLVAQRPLSKEEYAAWLDHLCAQTRTATD